MLVLSDACSNTLAVVLYDVLYVFNNWLSALTLKKNTSQVFSKVALHWYEGEFSKHSLHCFIMSLNGILEALHNGKRTEYGVKCFRNVATVCMFKTILSDSGVP